MTQLTLRLDGRATPVEIDTAIIAGWTGRDRAAVEEHIAELQALGVTRPSSVPVFYRVSASRPLAPQLRPYEQVAEHWDRLLVRSWIDDDVLYQQGPLAGMLHPDDLLPIAEPQLRDGTLMYCGTVPAIGGIRPAGTFRYELADPVLGRTIGARYAMRTLPLVS